MGDISTETSMEDILSSIKRIIAEEGDGSPISPRARKASRAAVPAPQPAVGGYDHDDEILELNEAVSGPTAPPRPAERAPIRFPDPVEPAPRAATLAPAPAPAPVAATPAAAAPEPEIEAETILSSHAAAASRGALETLSRMVVKPETPGTDSLEGLVRDMLRPMLQQWLDTNLPQIVETMVAREIARISNRD